MYNKGGHNRCSTAATSCIYQRTITQAELAVRMDFQQWRRRDGTGLVGEWLIVGATCWLWRRNDRYSRRVRRRTRLRPW